MAVRQFPESQHPLVQALSGLSDQALVQQFQQCPHEGRFFTALFCRYGALAYILIGQMAQAELQVDYLFAKIWRNIFFELTYLDLGQTSENFSLQTWIFNKIALCINQDDVVPVESIQYNLIDAPPPLWCYLQLALDQLPPLSRLVLTLSQTFRWSNSRIVAFLQAEGETMARETLNIAIENAQAELIMLLPADIKAIYLNVQMATPETV